MPVDDRRLRAGDVAEPASVEAIVVTVDFTLCCDGDEMLDSREPQPLGTELRQVGFMQKTESTCEAKLPSQAGSVLSIAEPADSGYGSVNAVNLSGRRASPRWQDLHLFQEVFSPRGGHSGRLPEAG